MAKNFVLRTHSLLIPNATLQFDSDNIVTIPMAVLEQLKDFSGYPEDQKAARGMLKYIEDLGIHNLTGKGVVQENGSILKVALDAGAENEVVDINNITEYDKRCFKVCKKLQQEENEVILVSKNPIIRMKAELIKIRAEEPKFEMFPPLKEQFSAIETVYTSDMMIGELLSRKDGYISIEDIYKSENIEWVTNMYLIIKGNTSSALGRFDGEKIVKLGEVDKPKTFKPLNKTQKFLLDALSAPVDEAPVVIVKGDAGTGKSFCSLVMALNKSRGIAKEPIFDRTLIAAPMIENIAKKIGAVPGNIDEKLNPYLLGIKDNLGVILKQNKFFNLDNDEGKDFSINPVNYIFMHGIVEIVSLDLLRGRTLPNVCFIIDEAQNIRPSDMKTIATRIGKGSKFIFLGDPSQVDAPDLNERYNGLTYLSEKFKGNELCRQICFEPGDTVRSSFAQIAAQVL